MRIQTRVLGGVIVAGATFCSVAEAQFRSATLKTFDGPRPYGVSSVIVQGSAPGQIFLSWPPVSGATSYMVWGDGLPSTGQQADPGGQIKARFLNPNLTVSGLSGPGMGTWTIGAYLDPAVASSTPVTPVTRVSHWITGVSGLQQPRMPAPSYQATSLNKSDAAWNDRDGPVMSTNMPPHEQVSGGCPQSIYFFLDGAAKPILADGWYLNGTSVQPEHMFTNVNGTLYFRVPKAANITTAPTSSNAYVFAMNCRGEYTNALPFKIWPGELHIEKAEPVSAAFGGSTKFLGGDKGNISGWGLKGSGASNNQKVILETAFVLPGSGERITRQTELQIWGENERYVSIIVPTLATLAPSTSALVDAKAYVVKDGVQSNSIPICYRDDPAGIRVAAYGGC